MTAVATDLCISPKVEPAPGEKKAMNKLSAPTTMYSMLRAVPIFLLLVATSGFAQSADWKSEQVADALRAAPPTVTGDARIYAWQGTKLTLVRGGNGPYTCVASGSWSLRLGKPALPNPDSFCTLELSRPIAR